MTVKEELRFGFVAVVGAPNAGKSTLVNRLVGAKVSIVTSKVQTTRIRVLGIVIANHSQIVLIDTPGIFTAKRHLERSMVKAAWRAVDDADIVAVIMDANNKDLSKTEKILENLNKAKIHPVLIINKIDLIEKARLLLIAKRLTEGFNIRTTFMISATQGGGVDDVLAYFAGNISEGKWLYPADQVTDIPGRLMAAEITREKAFIYLHQELPYSIAVETDDWEELDDGSLKIYQTIFVQKESQRKIVLGKGGKQIKQIGEKSRLELNYIFDRKVHLFLHVKVKENWPEKPAHFHTIGLEF